MNALSIHFEQHYIINIWQNANFVCQILDVYKVHLISIDNFFSTSYSQYDSDKGRIWTTLFKLTKETPYPVPMNELWSVFSKYLKKKRFCYMVKIDWACVTGPSLPSGPWFNIKMISYQNRKSHCGDKTILQPSYLHNGISYIGKASLYWIGALLDTWLCTLYPAGSNPNQTGRDGQHSV